MRKRRPFHFKSSRSSHTPPLKNERSGFHRRREAKRTRGDTDPGAKAWLGLADPTSLPGVPTQRRAEAIAAAVDALLVPVSLLFASSLLLLSAAALLEPKALAKGDDSMVLQQAAHLTGGLHLRPDEPTLRGLSQYLITHCLPSRQARQFLRMPRQRQPETRALCFLSKDPVEIGHACSVCLAVFHHDNLNACPVCGTRFALALPPRKKLKKAPTASKPTAPPSRGASGPS